MWSILNCRACFTKTTPGLDYSHFFSKFLGFSSVLFVWAVWIPQPFYLSWHRPCPWLWEPFVMQVHEIKWVFIIPKLTPSQWLAACLPAIPQWGENSMTRIAVICLTEKECTEATSHMLLWFAPMLHWFTGKMARQTVFATAVWFYCQSCSSCSCSARDKRDALWKKGLAHTHAHTSTVTAGISVTPQTVMRSLQPTQPELETGVCAAVKQKRVQHVPQKGQRSGCVIPNACPQRLETEDGEPVTSHRATRSDSQTLIMVSTSCSR